jgi:hypothetical protein
MSRALQKADETWSLLQRNLASSVVTFMKNAAVGKSVKVSLAAHAMRGRVAPVIPNVAARRRWVTCTKPYGKLRLRGPMVRVKIDPNVTGLYFY